MLALVVVGCGHPVFAFRPAMPRTAARGDTSAQLLLVEAGVDAPRWLPILDDPDRRLVSANAVVTFELPPGVSTASLVGAWLTEAAAPRCSGGVETSGVRLDVLAQPRSLPVDVDDFRAWHVLFERSADRGALPSERSVVDLQLQHDDDGGACLRLPFTRRGGEPDWQPYGDWFVGVGVRGRHFLPDPPAERSPESASISVSIGRWSSPTTRLFVEPGYAAASRQVSLGVHHEKVLLRHGKFALGATAGYVAMALPRRFDTAEPWFLHGPEVALRFKETLPESIGAGFPGLLQDASAEVVLPVTLWIGHGAQTRVLGFTVGWGLTFD